MLGSAEAATTQRVSAATTVFKSKLSEVFKTKKVFFDKKV